MSCYRKRRRSQARRQSNITLETLERRLLLTTAQDDIFAVNEDTALVGNVLANNGNGADSDPQGDTLSVSPTTSPSNGNVSLASNGAFTYTPNSDFWGSDSFTYTVTDGSNSDVGLVSITVNPINDPPRPITVSATVTEDATVPIRIFVITDGTRGNDDHADPTEIPEVQSISGAEGTVGNLQFLIDYVPAPNFFGVDSFEVTLVDGVLPLPGAATRQTGITTVNVTVIGVNDVPVARNDSFGGMQGSPVSGNLLADNGNGPDFDVDNDPLTVSTSPVSGPSNGEVVLSANGDFTYTPGPTFFGSDSFVYQLTDGTVSVTANVTFSLNANNAPTARPDAFSAVEETPLNGNVLADNGSGADSDSDGDGLSVSTTPAVAPAHGSLVLNANGTFTYTPQLNFFGSDSFTYTLNDSRGGSSTGVVSITVANTNDNPVAVNDAVSVNEDAVLSGNVLANNGSGADSDADGDPLTATLVSGASNGTVNLNANGTFTYTPSPNFNGADSFVYRISDGKGGTAQATVSITVISVNDNPVAADDIFTTNHNTPVSGSLFANNGNGLDSDPDGHALLLTTTPISGPANGSVVLSVNGSFTYTPNTGFSGMDAFTYEVTDGNGGSDTATVSISVASSTNKAPIAKNDAFSTTEDNAVAGNVLSDNGSGVDSDPDGDALTASIVSLPTKGTVSLAANGDFTYTPNTNFNGSDTFTYQLGDGSVVSTAASVTITVTPVNDPPTAGDDAFPVTRNVAFSGSVAAGDSDIDGDVLQFTVTPTVPPTNGVVVLGSNGDFTYTPNTGFTGIDSFRYEVVDGKGGSAQGTVTLNVLGTPNNPPVANNDNVATDQDVPLSGSVLIDNGNGVDSDPNGDPITVSLLSAPSNGTLQLDSDGDFTYTPNAAFVGTDTFTYTLRDNNLGSSTATVSIVVRAVAQTFGVKNDDFVVAEDTIVTGNVLANNGNGPDTGTNLHVSATRSTRRNPRITLNADGSFTYRPVADSTTPAQFTYVLRDDASSVATGTVTIDFTAVNDLSITNIGSTSPTILGLPTSFSASYVNTNSTLSPVATINWGDGSPVETVAITTAGLIDADHTFPNTGNFNVMLTLENSDGDTSSLATQVVVANTSPPPTVESVEFNNGVQLYNELTAIAAKFSSSVSVAASDLTIRNLTKSTDVDLSTATVAWDPATLTATWDLSAIGFDLSEYEFTLASIGIVDALAQPLDGDADGTAGDDFTQEFFVTLDGDTDLDGDVDFADFLKLSANFGSTDGTWGTGDFDADQKVEFPDFLKLSNNFGKSVSDPPVPSEAAIAAALSDDTDWLV